jgi:hypothetical protein
MAGGAGRGGGKGILTTDFYFSRVDNFSHHHQLFIYFYRPVINSLLKTSLMKNLLLLAALVLLYHQPTNSQQFTYTDNQYQQGFTVLQSSPQKAEISFSIKSWTLTDVSINRQVMHKIELPGHFLPNDEGMPDLPGSGRYIAIPQGAVAHMEIISMQSETLQNIELAPAPRIPKTTENGPLLYNKNLSVYNTNDFYPVNPVKLSEPTQIRGVDAVMLGITPFQYNPVTRELIVLRNINIEITFEGGSGQFGDNRLRSRWWDPLLSDMLLNYNELGSVDYSSQQSAVSSRQSAVSGQQSAVGSQRSAVSSQQSAVSGRQSAVSGQRDMTGFEYLIICPDDPDFLAWADTIRLFRNKQGIITGIVTTTETGGNTVANIRNYINNAYDTWDIPPAAILILGDYGSTGATVISPIWDSYCASDNTFADVNNDDLPDIVISRIMAQNAAHLEIMIDKFIGYETDPPTDPEYYAHPVTALGWQTERWFQVCIEVVGGFFRNELDKDPIRVNAVYAGDPEVDPWSTAPNTGTIMNYFGPNGLGYIPDSPSTLGSWGGGNASQINAALNNGSFLLLHRDHGYELGWGEPNYSNSSMSGLNNNDLTFVYSVNCLTGKFNYGSECFAEAFYRHPQRALGIIAASEVSYSFVNDTYVWGAFDNMWPEFMPAYGTTPESRGLLPAFSNAAGKFFLEQSSWPYNTDNKEVTYHLFHHFGDAFSSIYSEVPQELLVVHNEVLVGGSPTFTVQANEGSLIALSVNGEIIGVGDGTGSPENISITPQIPGTLVDIVVTKTNYFRYETSIGVISPDSPYVIYQDHLLNDQDGNGNGLMDYTENELLSITLQNIGNVGAENVSVIMASADPYIFVTDSTAFAGDIAGNQNITITDAFGCTVADSIPDGHLAFFTIKSDDGDTTWNSDFYITAHAPVLEFITFTIDDSEENNNGRFDPGETVNISVEIQNTGSSAAFNVMTGLSCEDNYVTILSAGQNGGNLLPGESAELIFSVSAQENTPGGFNSIIHVETSADHNRHGQGSFTCIIGQYSALVLDLDPHSNSGPAIMQSFNDLGLFADYNTEMPADLNNYKSVFVCLGILFTSHVLTEDEALVLKSFLENGGNIYLEGRQTWYADPQTSVHPMFNITPTYTNWYLMDSVYSNPGTFADGMEFGYDMTQPYNDHLLHATGPAFEVFSLLPDSLTSMVAYEAPGYKTIGTNFEFGGLVDVSHPSTRMELMSRILGFFGETLTGADNDMPGGKSTGIRTYPNPFSGIVNFSFHLDEAAPVTLDVYDVTGRLVSRIIDGRLEAGDHRFAWKAPGQDQKNSSGIYFYRFNAGTEIQGGKLLLIE